MIREGFVVQLAAVKLVLLLPDCVWPLVAVARITWGPFASRVVSSAKLQPDIRAAGAGITRGHIGAVCPISSSAFLNTIQQYGDAGNGRAGIESPTRDYGRSEQRGLRSRLIDVELGWVYGLPPFAIVNEVVAVCRYPAASNSVTCRACTPSGNVVGIQQIVRATFGQPMGPGYTAQTSWRESP